MFCPQCGTASQPDARFCVACGVSLVAVEAESSGLVFSNPPENAGFWLRVVATMIDGFLCQVVTTVVAFPLGFTMGTSMATSFPQPDIEMAATGLGFGVGLTVQWLWFTVAESSVWQASVGKKILGLKVTDLAGKKIDFGRANGRYWSKLVSGLFLCFGFLMVAFTARKQGLHDLLAGTLVVRQADF